MVPAAQSIEQINRILELMMRHFNSIIAALEDERPDIYPHWSVMAFDGRELDDAEGWAWGFVQGADLCRTDWQPLLGTDQGRAWYWPIGLLGEDDFGPEQDALTRTPAQRAELASQIPAAVLGMHAHWFPLRLAIHERTVARTLQAKVGRNEPCPCPCPCGRGSGSGKKFKKCSRLALSLKMT